MTCIELLALITFNLLLFQPIIEIILPPFSYYDEILAVSSLLSLFFSMAMRKSRFTREMKIALCLLFAIVVIGLFGNFLSGIVSDTFFILVDILACSKFFIIYFALKSILGNTSYFVSYMARESKVLLVLMLACLVINQFVDIGMTYEMRYGLKAFQFVFIHPTHMVTLSLACMAFIYSDASNGWKKYIGIALVLMAMSLRSRWVALALVIVLIIIFVKKGSTRAPFVVIGVGSVSAFLVGQAQMSVYYGSASESARGHLMTTALSVFQNFFPLGAGFASFGSGVTKTIYSPLYYQYGLQNVYGLAPNNPSYLTDTFWPVVLAQFGFLGLIIWLLLLIMLVVDFYRLGIASGMLVLSLTMIAAILISTTASGSIFSMQMITLLVAFMTAMKANIDREACERA
ncbi:hypothetical protein [Gordonibacter urolithinfaciens]|uniref:O-antigen ligase domain-containing protein n=2 Tax=Gordonibacter urolithinfaciens TaxID=1335613 RepID=A0A6N8IKQ4_9ACTN|nr:hypothetical protein [Gordonibacter urolithinfaciens]MVM55879.1 hypothetical protein [Gordonibacter urolithinfaciens]MVN15393.1 hypothetical protein [Gordonibacter urolithinfaciens]MVN38358.1 hypothetical protein [Gordonibacter urolithinfaciens]MVN57003.1 hypothetical protein [Gordonibacter urolithinfaciens]